MKFSTSRRAIAVAMAAAALLAASCTADSDEASKPRDPIAERSSDGSTGGGASSGAELRWNSCEEKTLSGLQCATLAVPLDPDRPDGRTIELALARRPADKSSERIGSLVINPGGPGGSGVELVNALASGMAATVLDRFDIVGFDPRGVGRSTAVHCVDDPEADNALDRDPDTQAEIDAMVAEQQRILAACLQRHGDLLPHLSTADAAHDLDAIRAAVGDEKLTYLGFSYGTELGATYAALFPDRIRALVLDGAVGPNLSDEELSTTQAKGFEGAFSNFVNACTSDPQCAARPDALGLYQKVNAAVEQAPIPVSTPGETRQLTVGEFQTGVAGAMYEQALWAYLARGLAEAARGDGATLLALSDLYHQRKPDGSYPNETDANLAISCADTTERPTLADAKAAAVRYASLVPLFGAQWGWGMMACNGWPLAADPHPTIATTTAAPILVVGTLHDPATPYVGAEQLTKALAPAARLLTWDGEGHTAYPKSDCVTEAVDTFLVELTQPAEGTVCRTDADKANAAFAGIGPDLREAFIEGSGMDPKLAGCVATKVSDSISATDLVAIYGGEFPSSLTQTVTQAATSCARGG